MKSFFTRLVSGIILLAIMIAAGILGGWFLLGLTLLISVIGYTEFARVFQLERRIFGILGGMVSVLAVMLLIASYSCNLLISSFICNNSFITCCAAVSYMFISNLKFLSCHILSPQNSTYERKHVEFISLNLACFAWP